MFGSRLSIQWKIVCGLFEGIPVNSVQRFRRSLNRIPH
uniref:Uncharacterized protein n=1 Tax=Anguilla anguilla TaxID=7936 RepID=A0A0E9S9Y9_ANGAN